jgi:hypothetical protein
MSNSSENDVVSAVCQYLEYRPYKFWRQNNIPVFDGKRKVFRKMPKWCLKGVPDILVLAFDTIVFIECKTEKGRLSEAQKEFRDDVEARGYQYIVASSSDDVIAAGL